VGLTGGAGGTRGTGGTARANGQRARGLPRRAGAAASSRAGCRASPAALEAPAAPVFLRGRDADARLRELAAARAAARPLLGALAVELVRRRLYEELGYRSLGDFARERLGVGARAVREWARVGGRLAELPLLCEAVRAGEVSWGVARAVVALATPETEAACVETVRGRSVRAVLAIVAAVREGAAADPGAPGAGDFEAAAGDAADAEEERVRVRLGASEREARFWYAAVELARRVAGEELAVWQCAEWIAAEAASAIGGPEPEGGAGERADPERGVNGAGGVAAGVLAPAGDAEHGLRHRAFPGLRWTPLAAALPAELAALGAELSAQGPREVERRLVAAVAFLQSVDFETGRILRQVVERRLHREPGFASFERYVRERLDLAPRTARRLVALARAEERAPAVATAFRSGRIHAFQAHALARVADRASAAAWVARARAVSLRRLLDELDLAPRREIAFLAPPEVARFFLGMLARAGSLERLLAHAIATWAELGRQFRDYADFERDGFRCTVPGCTGRRNLHSHHLWYRSHQGPDVPWNRTTLCAHHHQRGQHGGTLRIRGRAPDALVYELGIRTEAPERFRSGDVRIRPRAR
jgi:hypothetical protein